MKCFKSLKKCAALTTVFCLALSVLPFPVSERVAAAADVLPEASYNLGSQLISGSYLSDTDDGYMRVFYNGTNIGIEYYDDSFNILSKKSVDMELDMWGGFYQGSDAYYLIEGCSNTEEDDTAEVVRVISYDTDWNRTGAASITPNTGLWGAEVRYPFDYGCVQAAEYNGYLYIVTGHEGYVDEAYNQGHQGFLMMAVNEATMEGEIIDADLWHSFAQYIENNGPDMYVLEQSEGSRYTKLSKYTADSGSVSADASIPVLRYGGSRTSAWAIPCYASVDGMALSSDSVLCLGTSIDQSDYDNVSSDTAFNIYLTVTPMSDFSEEATEVKWLTDYVGGGKYFYGTKITRINDDRFMISWEENDDALTASDLNDGLSDSILHYLFVDGNGNSLSEEFTVRASISDCQPVVKGSKVVFYSSGFDTVDFYSIDAATGKFSKKVYRIAGENAQWDFDDGILTISGTGELFTNGYSLSGWTAIRDDVEKIIIEGGITSIPENKFTNFSNLKEVQIENGVKSIGEQAFAFCENLEKITIPSSVTEIGDDILWTGYSWLFDGSHVVTATIYSSADSFAALYAQENGINFAVINSLIKGDANGDGVVNVRDAAFIAQKLAQRETDQLPECADYNGDSTINVRDAAAIAKSLASGGK
ncbi:MAG: leucine-rich repeat protein [Porcipelethomonas sp.]